MKRLGKYGGIVRLALLLIVLPVAVYRFSLGRTVALWGEVREGERIIEAAEAGNERNAPAAVLDTAERIAGGGLLDSLSRFLAGGEVAVVRYTPFLTRDGDDFALRTAEIVLSGGFAPLVRTLERLERCLPDGRFLSAELKTVRRGRQTSLQLTLVVQQLTDKP